jgi:hypothetical protein
VFFHVFEEVLTGLNALLMGLVRSFNQQIKFKLWHQTASDFCR